MMLPSRSSKKSEAASKAKSNPEPRCAVILLLDVSGSMAGPKGESLNAALPGFLDDVRRDDLAAHRLELAVVAFGKDVKVALDFTAVADVKSIPPLKFSGNTALAGGVMKGLEILKARKAFYRAEGLDTFRPWVFLMTDGAPSDLDLVPAARDALFKAVGEHRLLFFPIGVKGADFDFLKSICPAGSKVYELEGLKFRDLFRWMSRSVVGASQGDPDEEPPITEPLGVKEPE